jgi:hypothetical protein
VTTKNWHMHFPQGSVHAFLAMPAVLIGTLGVLQDSWRSQAPLGWANMHTLFGAVLCVTVIAQFLWQIAHVSARSAQGALAYARRQSREVYCLLYCLVAIKEIQYLLGSVAPRGGAATMADAMKGMQCYLVYGIVALVAIRVMAALHEFRAIDRSLQHFG